MAFVGAIKIIGVGSLGLLSGSLIYQSLETIPQWISQINKYSYDDGFINRLISIKLDVNTNRIINIVLGGLSSCLFGLSYISSSIHEKHPYLLYLSLIGPLTLGTLYYYNFNNFQKISSKLALEQENSKFEKQAVKSEQDSQKLDPDLLVSDDLGKSYIHVSEDESTTSTPSISSPSSPKISDGGYTEDLKIDQEINQTLIKREFINDLQNMEASYYIGSSISGLGFLLSLVGIVGDYYM